MRKINRTALIDAGVLCFKIAAGSTIVRYHIHPKDEVDYLVSFKFAKEAIEWLNLYGGAYEKEDKDWYNRYEDYTVSKSINYVSKSRVHETIKNYIEFIKNDVKADEILICFGHPKNNFRNDLATILPYKGNRSEDKPYHYSTVVDYIQSNYNYVIAEYDWEDDDMLACYSNIISNSVICTVDKDLLQVPGIHYHMDKNILFEVTELEGLRNFYKQLYIGDKVDNIPGYLEITGYRKNIKKISAIIDKLDFEKDMFNEVKAEYALALGAKNTDDLDCILFEIGNLLYLRRDLKNEQWKIPTYV